MPSTNSAEGVAPATRGRRGSTGIRAASTGSAEPSRPRRSWQIFRCPRKSSSRHPSRLNPCSRDAPRGNLARAAEETAPEPELFRNPIPSRTHRRRPRVQPGKPARNTGRIHPRRPRSRTVAARELPTRRLQPRGPEHWPPVPAVSRRTVRHAVWPFVWWRSCCCSRWRAIAPSLSERGRLAPARHCPAVRMAGIDVPLPRNVDLVAIDTSDLQSRQRARPVRPERDAAQPGDYAQAWPALELTLTDTTTPWFRAGDERCRLSAPAISPRPSANGEVAVACGSRPEYRRRRLPTLHFYP